MRRTVSDTLGIISSDGSSAARVDRRWVNYGKAAAVTALATLLRGGLDRLFGQLPMFITFYPAVVVSAALWGTGPGLLATALGMASADLLFIKPIGSFAIAETADAVGLGVFGSVGAALSVLLGRVRAAVVRRRGGPRRRRRSWAGRLSNGGWRWRPPGGQPRRCGKARSVSACSSNRRP